MQGLGSELTGIEVRVEAAAAPPESATGDGCGCLLVARTSTGCLLGSSGTGDTTSPSLLIALKAPKTGTAPIHTHDLGVKPALAWKRERGARVEGFCTAASRELVGDICNSACIDS